jgi:NAD(P)-dependent dehydrogenase (short-subunit alcohol dehydrogenase family)
MQWGDKTQNDASGSHKGEGSLVFELTGKQAVVTGAASGIGFAIAQLFASQGANVVLIDLDLERANAAAAAIRDKTAGLASGAACDVGSEESVQKTFAEITGPIDILVNCAGVAHVGTLQSTSLDDFERLFAVNVRGTYLCMRAAIEAMLKAGRGVILNMASIAATAGIPDRFAYSMTKGAVLSMTLSVARDYIAQGIRCNCISPARVHTPFVDGFLAKNYPGQEAEKMKLLAQSQPIGRMGTPEEIAMLALYLCSDASSFLTGVDYPIDGGFFNLR